MPTVDTARLFMSEHDIGLIKKVETLMNKALEKDDISNYDKIVLANRMFYLKKITCHNNSNGAITRIYEAFYDPGKESEIPSQAFINELVRFHMFDHTGVIP